MVLPRRCTLILKRVDEEPLVLAGRDRFEVLRDQVDVPVSPGNLGRSERAPTRSLMQPLLERTGLSRLKPRESPRKDETDRETAHSLGSLLAPAEAQRGPRSPDAHKLKPGFVFASERIPLVNLQRGIFESRRGEWTC
jgi:hypothetical protein